MENYKDDAVKSQEVRLDNSQQRAVSLGVIAYKKEKINRKMTNNGNNNKTKVQYSF